MKQKRTQKLENLSDIELIKQYSQIMSLMRERKIVKSKNTVSELGKRYAIEVYNDTPDLPNLQLIPSGIQNVNAMSKQGERYAIKSTTKAMLGAFAGLNSPDSIESQPKMFEFVVIVLLNEDFGLTRIIELTWSQVLVFRKWDKSREAWYLSVTKNMLEAAKTIFADEPETKKGNGEISA